MTSALYKKMAGTSAVFLSTDYKHASPVERDGMIWAAAELHLSELPEIRTPKLTLANVLALEGLEDYDPPENGDVRFVKSVGEEFVYFKKIQAWVHVKSQNNRREDGQ